MTRHTWQLVIGACLCVGLLPGCALFPFFTRNKPLEPPKDQQVESGNLGSAMGKFPPGGGPLAGPGGPDSPYNPNNPNPQVLRILQPDGRIVPSVLPFDNPDVRIVEPNAGGDEPQEPPPFLRQPPPKPAPQAVRPPPEPQEPLIVALAHLLKNDQEAATALKLLDRYDPATRDWFVRILPMLASLNRTPVGNLPPEEVTNMQEQLQWLLLALCARAPLVLDKMCYCEPEPDPERRGGYRYRRLPNEHAFLPRSGALPGEWVCIYVELRNLGTVRNGSFYETRLSSAVTISEDEDGKIRRYYRKFDARPLRSPDLSSDFYNTYSFYMPAGIPPGRYYLTLEVWDETTNPPRHKSSKPLPFVVAAEAVAGN